MTMKKKKIAIVFGTRPEAIKMAPVIMELNKNQDVFDTTVIVTAQHREMLDQVLKVFKITPDYDLNIMRRNQTLSDITSDVLQGIEKVLLKEEPDMVLVHGDTTTSFASALASYYQQVPIGHVEAGLRTYDKYFPFPEEANRQLIDNLSELLFVPTEATKSNLLGEGISEDKITVTGNTVIDAIHYTKRSESEHPIFKIMDESPDTKWILLTMHRRENHGIPMNNVFKALRKLIDSREDVSLVMPVHMSPIVRQSVSNLLSGHERIHLVEPLEVDVFHKLINRAFLVMTDSGGLQEEAPALDVPVLVLRDKTERPEGLEAGTLRIVGTDEDKVAQELNELLSNERLYTKMSKAINPYGDGLASGRIVNEITKFFGK